MACKYVKDFSFPTEAGFSGSAGVQHVSGYKRGGKVEKVMSEYKDGDLHSGSKNGPVVTNRKQAVAIALSEAGKSKPVKKSLGGVIKALSPLAAVASGDAPKGIGALGGVAGMMLERALRKKKMGQPMTLQDQSMTAQVGQPGMRRGGKVGVPAHNSKPMFGK